MEVSKAILALDLFEAQLDLLVRLILVTVQVCQVELQKTTLSVLYYLCRCSLQYTDEHVTRHAVSQLQP